MNPKTFIETQFPISKLSKESYKERKANYSQTLTGLGKWWGRKPLILVRATLLGLLMPASDDPKKDREIFLKILTMDPAGLWQRQTKAISLKTLFQALSPAERNQWFAPESTPETPKYLKQLSKDHKVALQKRVFERMNYDEKLTYCDRPEQVTGPDPAAWQEINAHLNTHAQSLPKLFQELGQKQFGHIPRVGDAFCGGGSVPFEAARLGCEAFGSDLNPVAALLTWAALNIIGGGPEVVAQVKQAQQQVYDAVDQQITDWGIEHHEQGWRADAYLYCTEARCPECGYRVPLAPSWVIGEKTRTIASLDMNPVHQAFEIHIKMGVSDSDLESAQANGTVKDSYLVCPNCKKSTPISSIRGEHLIHTDGKSGLRLWTNEDLVPRPDDVFQERLYCIRWVEVFTDEKGQPQTRRFYRAPDENDLKREATVLELLQERFAEWQEKGYIPERKIHPGAKTDEPIRTRGWTHWHHLFNPRQLLVNGLILSFVDNPTTRIEQKISNIIAVGRCLNFNSRITRWVNNAANEKGADAFNNQALNTLYIFISRPLSTLATLLNYSYPEFNLQKSHVIPLNGHQFHSECDFYITDPPYADAINYHELSEYFLSWYEKHLKKIFPDWYTDSKRALAITGSDQNFRINMVDAYKNLAQHMPENGLQVVMFTHKDPEVWADLTVIMWAAGLRVTAAWTIATETDTALKTGNYVQGTVLLVLRKQDSDTTTFLDQIYPQVETEVKNQLHAMLELDDTEDPNFGDADYQLAAYAAALRVLTQYRQIEELDIEKELMRKRTRNEKSKIEELIESAVRIACDYLIPQGFDSFVWKVLEPDERFYLKGLEVESHGEYRQGVFQELARGFGVQDYQSLLASGKANQSRLKTASEFGNKFLRDAGFGATLLRQVLYAIGEVLRAEDAQIGKNWLRNELSDYWSRRTQVLEVLKFLSLMGIKIPHWGKDAEAARLLAGAVANDSV